MMTPAWWSCLFDHARGRAAQAPRSTLKALVRRGLLTEAGEVTKAGYFALMARRGDPLASRSQSEVAAYYLALHAAPPWPAVTAPSAKANGLPDPRRSLVAALSQGGAGALYRNVPEDVEAVRELIAAWRAAYLSATRHYHRATAARRAELHHALAAARHRALERAPWLDALIASVGSDTAHTHYLFVPETFATEAMFPPPGAPRHRGSGGLAVNVDDATSVAGFALIDGALLAILRELRQESAKRASDRAAATRADAHALDRAASQRADRIGRGMAEPVTVAALARDRTLLNFRRDTMFRVDGLRLDGGDVVLMASRTSPPSDAGSVPVFRASLAGLGARPSRREAEARLDERLREAAGLWALSKFAGA